MARVGRVDRRPTAMSPAQRAAAGAADGRREATQEPLINQRPPLFSSVEGDLRTKEGPRGDQPNQSIIFPSTSGCYFCSGGHYSSYNLVPLYHGSMGGGMPEQQPWDYRLLFFFSFSIATRQAGNKTDTFLWLKMHAQLQSLSDPRRLLLHAKRRRRRRRVGPWLHRGIQADK
ncbi:hypothetical protein BC567DRAFT_73458 [Phyllosticta citribraziliensis]